MNKFKIDVLIVDSEPSSLKHIKEILEGNALIWNIDCVENSDDALLKLIKSSPDIVFIEYPVKGKAGNEIVTFIQSKLAETRIVFLSETKEHALAAIRSGIFNYLLKPVVPKEIEKIITKIHLSKQISLEDRLSQIIEKTNGETRLKFQTTRGYLLINPEEIIYCKSEGIYTELFLTSNRVELCYLFLSKLEEILKQYHFMKISRSCMINKKYLRKVYRDNNTVILSADGQEHEVKGSKPSIRILSKTDSE